MKQLLITLTALLLTACGSNNLSSGPGTQTTNGFTVGISATGTTVTTLRPRNYRIGDTLFTNDSAPINAITLSSVNNETLTIENLIPGSYMLSMSNGDTLAAIDTFTISDEDVVDLGTVALQEVGALSGVVDSLFLAKYQSAFLYIEGLERTIPIGSDGSFSLESLAPWNYTIAIVGTSDTSSIEGNSKAVIQAGKTADIGTVEPLYTKQYKKVRAFLDALGHTTLEVESVTTANDSAITSLALNNKGITAVPDNFSALSFLEELSMDSNAIVLMPIELGNFTKLTTLSLKRNQFTVMPVSLGTCKNIMELDFSDNKLDRVSEVISQLKKLETLNVSNNEVLSLPESIIQNSALKVLDCSSNKLSNFPTGIISALTNIEIVDFSNNLLDTATLTTAQIDWITEFSGDSTWIATQK